MTVLQQRLHDVVAGNADFVLRHEALANERVREEREHHNLIFDRMEANHRENAISPQDLLASIGTWVFGARQVFIF